MSEEVHALKPKKCQKCGIDKQELDFSPKSKECKACRRAYTASRRVKSIGIIGFSDFKTKTPAVKEGTKHDQGKREK